MNAVLQNLWAGDQMTHSPSSPDIVEELISTAPQGPDSRRTDLLLRAADEIAVWRDAAAELQYEAGMYRSLYEAAIERSGK